jgi:hypothetical protein
MSRSAKFRRRWKLLRRFWRGTLRTWLAPHALGRWGADRFLRGAWRRLRMVDQCPMAAANRLVGQADHARRNYGRCNWRVPWHAARLAELAQAEQFLAPLGRNRTRLKKSGRSARRGGSLEVTRETVEEVGSLDASRVRWTRLSRLEQISAVRNRTFAITYHRKLIPGASWCAHDLALRRPEGAARVASFEIRARPADDALLPAFALSSGAGIEAAGRARSRRTGPAIRRGDDAARLARAVGLLQMRQPRD